MEDFESMDIKSLFLYLKDNYGVECFKDKRFMWMIQNLAPLTSKEKLKTFSKLDDYGLLMKISDSCCYSLNDRNSAILEVLKLGKNIGIDQNNSDLNLFLSTLDYFNPSNIDFSKKIQNNPDYFNKIITDAKLLFDLDLVHCKAGTFMMGSPENELGREDDETLHKVALTQDFLMNKYITNEHLKWKSSDFKIIDKNSEEYKRLNIHEKMNYCSDYSIYMKEKDSLLPLYYVSRKNSLDFCNNLNKKLAFSLPAGYAFSLPTEAQWEYACRAGTNTALYNGKNLTVKEGGCPNLNNIAWYLGNTGCDPDEARRGCIYEVGQKEPNSWGLYDMLGSTWEWCYDIYMKYPKDEVVDPVQRGNVDYLNDPEQYWRKEYIDNKWVMRGGSYVAYAYSNRSACRNTSRDGGGYGDVCFRIALTPVHKASGYNEEYIL